MHCVGFCSLDVVGAVIDFQHTFNFFNVAAKASTMNASYISGMLWWISGFHISVCTPQREADRKLIEYWWLVPTLWHIFNTRCQSEPHCTGSALRENTNFEIAFTWSHIIFLYYSKCEKVFLNVFQCRSRAISNQNHAAPSFADINPFLYGLSL